MTMKKPKPVRKAKKKAKMGAPGFTAAQTAKFKELYLEVLEKGTTEAEIDQLRKGGKLKLPSIRIRFSWQHDDAEFVKLVSRARTIGAECIVGNYEGFLNACTNKLIKGELPPSAIGALISEKGRHARWRAGKDAAERFGEKIGVKHDGEVKFTFSVDEAKL